MRDDIPLRILGCFAIISMIAFVSGLAFFANYTPSAADLADGKSWAEYTSDGQRHWVWRKGK